MSTYGFLRRFTRTESFGGAVIVLSVVAALVWSNMFHGYESFWLTNIHLGFGNGELYVGLDHLIGEGAMSAFFLLIGLEVRRELTTGHLRTWSARRAPLFAAIAGTLVPAAIYLTIAQPSDSAGWAVPTATDIALAIGFFALVSRWLHPNARILLLSIAVMDDVIGIGILAFIASGSINPVFLILALLVTGFFFLLGRRYELPVWVLVFCWLALIGLLAKAGIHSTLAGVLVAVVTSPSKTANPAKASVSERLVLGLNPWVSFVILPLFVISNAGVLLCDTNSTTTAVVLALFIGKPLAVIVTILAGTKLGVFTIAPGIMPFDVLILGLLGGAGLTVSALIAEASLPDPGPATLGALIGSGLSLLLAVALTLTRSFLRNGVPHWIRHATPVALAGHHATGE